jgi:hypothetical protein
MRAVATVLLMVTAAAASVLGRWQQDLQAGKPVADTEWRKSVDGLGVQLLLIDDEEAFLKEWTTTPESHVAMVKSVSRVKRGAVLTAVIVFSGCGRPNGNCDATVDFTVLGPDGSVHGDVRGAAAWSGPAPKPGIVVLSGAHLQMRIDRTRQLGEYTVHGTLRESHSKREVNLTQRFEVIE